MNSLALLPHDGLSEILSNLDGLEMLRFSSAAQVLRRTAVQVAGRRTAGLTDSGLGPGLVPSRLLLCAMMAPLATVSAGDCELTVVKCPIGAATQVRTLLRASVLLYFLWK